jgi:hypothetical protein
MKFRRSLNYTHTLHMRCNHTQHSLSLSDGDLDTHSRLNGDGGDLSHDLRGSVQVQNALVDAHLEAIVGVGTLTARGLADAKLQDLGGHADRAGHLDLLLLSLVLEQAADLLKSLDLGGRQGDADLVHGSALLSDGLGFDGHFRHSSKKVKGGSKNLQDEALTKSLARR